MFEHSTPNRRGLDQLLRRVVVPASVLAGTTLAVVLIADPVFAATALVAADSLEQVVENLRVWLVGILAGLATLFLVVGGLRYIVSGGDPGEVEKAKSALKSAALGYALALLAPLIVTLVAQLVG